MMTRLRIDLTNGILEIEGEEEFVKTIYGDFKEKVTVQQNVPPDKPTVKDVQNTSPSIPIKKSKRVSKLSTSSESYSLIKDIDFTKGDVSLKDFYKQKSPRSFTENNVVFVYYLKQFLKIPQVTLDHIFTCYDEVGARKPGAFKQSVADTSSKKGWLNTTSFEDITVSIRGQNYVTHDLPTQLPEKK